MGEHYVHSSILAILTLGYLLPTTQSLIREILNEMKVHGKIGAINSCILIVCFLAGSQ
jgi:hypothetical protein